jgi:hypothetical protein
MTKQEMIKQIQLAEAAAWQTLSRDRRRFGIDSDITNTSRKLWKRLYDLREAAGAPGLGAAEMAAEDLLPY